ncbi:MAG: ATP-binding cassette domain-containing protein [Planctomycetota bacterium]
MTAALTNSNPRPRLLDAQGLSRTLEESGRVLLDGVDLFIDEGDRIGILGESGSGKTTLLRSLAMLDASTDGRLSFRSAPLEPDGVPAYRRRVAHVSQQAGFIDASVRENLKLGFRFASADSPYDETEAISILGRLGRTESILDQNARELSGGERQMVAFVRALLVDPTILLLDEPTAAMDGDSAAKLESLILHWCRAKPDRALVWISHDMDQIRRMTNRRVRLRSGQLDEAETVA